MAESQNGKITHEQFMLLIEPSFAACDNDEDMQAIVARAHIIVVTEKHIFHRVATPEKTQVPFFEFPDMNNRDLFSDESKPAWRAYKQNPTHEVYPANFQEDTVWSQEFLRRLIRGEPLPPTLTVRGPSISSASSSTVQVAPALMSGSEIFHKVKRERQFAFDRKLAKHHGMAIDITEDSPPSKRVAHGPPNGTSSSSSSSTSAVPGASTSAASSAAAAPFQQKVTVDSSLDLDDDDYDIFANIGHASLDGAIDLDAAADE